MRLSAFIEAHMGEILVEWDRYALTMTPAADKMSFEDLRDHAESMLREIATDLDTPQTAAAQLRKSHGTADGGAASSAAQHGVDRHAGKFTMLQLSAEFRALRAAVLRMWLPRIGEHSVEALDDVIRFNEAIDQAFAESIVTFSSRTEQARDMYDAILGHDLRGPLAAMTMAGSLLANPLSDSNRVMVAQTVARSVRFMAAMVDDLLVLSRIKLAKGLQVKRAPVDMAALCEAAVVDARAMHPLSVYRIALHGRIDADLDAVRIHQLLVNLLGNAAQHGAEGAPILLAVDWSEAEVCFSVSNKGPRMGEAALQTLFEPLTQHGSNADGAARGKTSLGLGLHIAREIATAHGGNIAVTSTDEETTFAVRLPRRAQAA